MCAWLGTGKDCWGAGIGQEALGKCPHPPARLGSRGPQPEEALPTWTKKPSISTRTGLNVRCLIPLTGDSGERNLPKQPTLISHLFGTIGCGCCYIHFNLKVIKRY